MIPLNPFFPASKTHQDSRLCLVSLQGANQPHNCCFDARGPGILIKADKACKTSDAVDRMAAQTMRKWAGDDIWPVDQHDKWKYKFGLALHSCTDP
ncbi:hypothetical protein K438DRAFT_1170762 [Mycena galopus ATCC 62051]|nr:hypothetical protein K438DRAFT_1170762 [Mycena galopus ATCC 62051]